MTSDPSLFRAPLFVPGDRPDRFGKAAASAADAVILDLEDAVAPSEKAKARRNLVAQLPNTPVIVRINPFGTPWFEDDLSAVGLLGVAWIMVPKVETLEQLDRLAAALRGPQRLIVLVESAKGLAKVRTLASHSACASLAFGSVDFAADIGCAHDHLPLLHARAEIVLAARAAGLPAPIDGVTLTVDNTAAAAADAAFSRSLGFGGKLCIHPSQVGPVLAAYQPDAEEIAWARKVLATGEGAVALNGAMIDEPVRRRARQILAEIRGGQSGPRQ